MIKRIVLAAAMVLVTYGVAAGQVIDLEGRYWFLDLDGKVQVEGGGLPGTKIDLDKDLGLETEGAPELRLTIFAGLNAKIRLGYSRLRLEGDRTIDESIQFGGTTFTASQRVVTDLDIDYYRLGWVWQFVAVPGIFKLGPILEAKGFMIDAKLESTGAAGTQREKESFAIALPSVGLALDITPHERVNLFAEASGLWGGDLGHFIDGEAGIRLILFRNLTVSGGYRILDLRAGEGDDFVRVRFLGPFVGASVRF